MPKMHKFNLLTIKKFWRKGGFEPSNVVMVLNTNIIPENENQIRFINIIWLLKLLLL